MPTKELRKKYPSEKCKAIRNLFSDDVEAWAPIKKEADLDVQCVTDMTDDPAFVAGPWPEQEWQARHAKGQERPCLHEDVLTQFKDIVTNQLEMNPMGIEAEPAGDGADEKTAEFLEGRIRQWEYENNAQLSYQIASSNAVLRSYGIWKNEAYYRKGFSVRICIEALADPDSGIPGFAKKPDWSDLRRFWEIQRMTREEYREKYGDIPDAQFDTWAIEDGKWADDRTVQVVAYWHFDIDEKELVAVQMEDGSSEAVQLYADDETMRDVDSAKIIKRRSVRQKKVIKTIFNGFQALEETEWIDPGDPDEGIDPEIPFYIVTGRVKYQHGRRTLESLIRKGRIGQLLYDYLISTIQEVIAITGKPVRSGPEGVFDTTTNWSPRDITAYKEWKPVVGPNGELLPAPVFELYEPPLQALEGAKQSILIGIQNAIGMSSTERKDRAAKSGKALDQLQQEMSVATAHYFGAQRVQQERQYRALQRILPAIEKDESGQLPIRNKFGKHEMSDILYRGRHAVTVGAGKLYQNLQDKQEEFAEQLTKVTGDPAIVLVSLIGAAKMKGLGPYGDQLEKVFSRLLVQLHPNLADLFPDSQPEGQNPQATAQQSQRAIQALNAKIQQDEKTIVQLMHERDAKILDLQSKEREGEKDRKVKIQVAEIQASTKESVDTLAAQVQSLKFVSDFLTERMGVAHEANQAALDRQHQADMATQQQQAAADAVQVQTSATEQQPVAAE